MRATGHKGEKRSYLVVFFLFLGLSFIYGITRIYGFTLFPDEFGYWSSAARAVGYDWSEVASHGSYYSYGYSLILIPILLLCSDAVAAYRLAVGVNALLLAATFLLLYGMLKKLFRGSAPAHNALYAGIAVCYPTWLLYMNMTMTEVLLVFCFILVCSLFLRYMEHPTAGRFAAVIVCAVYMYTVHMRTIPVLLSCIGCLLPGLAIKQDGAKSDEKSSVKKICPEAGAFGNCAMRKFLRLILAVVFIAAVLTLAGVLKQMVRSGVYAKADSSALSVNDYAGQADKIRSLFTWKGFSEFLISLTGKLYYLGFASFGLFFAGMWYLGKKIFAAGENVRYRLFYLFVTLSATGQILVCAVFTKGYGRIDGLCYGRYDEHILPLVMAVGCYALTRMRHPVIYTGVLLLGGLPVVAMLEHIIAVKQMTSMNGGYFIAGFAYLLRYISFEPENYFWKAYLMSGALILALLAIILTVRRRREFVWLLAVWIGVEALLGTGLNEDMVYCYGRMRYHDGRMVAVIEEARSRNPQDGADTETEEGRPQDGADTETGEGHPQDGTGSQEPRRIVCYGSPDSGIYASIIQFQLRREKIYFLTPDESDMLREQDFVLVCGDGEDRTGLEQLYSECDAYGAFWLYYNE